MRETACLYFHSPCFDGIVSGVLAWDFLETTQGWTVEQFYPVNYDARPNWLATELQTPCAVVDFLYHPQARFWADHHLTTFLTEAARQDYETRKSEFLTYDDQSDSCAALLWSHFANAFNYRNPRYEQMVEWANKIDAARYASVDEAILGDAPALRISRSLAAKNSKARGEYLLKELRHRTLDEVAQLPDVQASSEQVYAKTQAGLQRFAKASALQDDGIVTFDVNSEGVIINRYAPYYFFRQARYSIGIIRWAHGASITAMRNPWQEFPSVFLGKIFEKFGGGGHRRVGSVLLADDRAREADLILKQLLQAIREQEKASRSETA